jgi:hypothetical protein
MHRVLQMEDGALLGHQGSESVSLAEFV